MADSPLQIQEHLLEEFRNVLNYSINKIHQANLSYSDPENSLEIDKGLKYLEKIRRHLTFILVNKDLYKVN
jgi:hypothetical protein